MRALGELFPKAKFIQLVRHPGDFVRSGIRRKYYSGNENDDSRITPLINDQYNNKIIPKVYVKILVLLIILFLYLAVYLLANMVQCQMNLMIYP